MRHVCMLCIGIECFSDYTKPAAFFSWVILFLKKERERDVRRNIEECCFFLFGRGTPRLQNLPYGTTVNRKHKRKLSNTNQYEMVFSFSALRDLLCHLLHTELLSVPEFIGYRVCDRRARSSGLPPSLGSERGGYVWVY